MEKLLREPIILKPEIKSYLLKDDGIFPNNEWLPLLIYKNALHLPKKKGADWIEKIFEINNWKNSWRDGIFDYHHYHSITHEVLGIYNGIARLQFGGEKGIIAEVSPGDVIIIPAGVAHKNIESGKDFKCVGAYPNGHDYDINYGKESEREKAIQNIRKVAFPKLDPVYGLNGPFIHYWGKWE